jgi:hypothetical protein
MTDLNMTAMTDWWPLLERYDGGFEVVHRWPVPSDIRFQGDSILYGKRSTKWMTAPSSKLLSAFVALADAPTKEIERYAKQCGVLGLCKHGLVWGHNGMPGQNGNCLPSGADAVERWRYFAGGFRFLLNEATRLHKARMLRSRSPKAAKEIDRFLKQVYAAVRIFGCLRPILVVENGRFDVKLGGEGYATGLPAALTSQLLFTLAGASGLATCADCGRLFAPRRRPRKGQNSYCQNCGIRAAWRAAQRKRRKPKTRREQNSAEGKISGAFTSATRSAVTNSNSREGNSL